jgi:hypothetical protein
VNTTDVQSDRAPINKIWGASDGVVFFTTDSQFGRLNEGKIELLATPADGDPGRWFSDLWGNSSSEVFVTLGDSGFGELVGLLLFGVGRRRQSARKAKR